MYSINRKNSFSGKASGLFALFIVLLYSVIIVKDASIGERLIIMRFWELFLSGLFAVIHPYFLYPDENLSLIQALNPTSGKLFRYQLKKQKSFLSGVILVFLVVVFIDPGQWDKSLLIKSEYALNSILFIIGLFTYSYRKYVAIGKESQEYQEGLKGEKLREFGKETGQLSISLGSLPTMQSTIFVGAVGMLAVVLGAYLSQYFHMDMEWIPGFLLLILGVVPFRKIVEHFDRYFYQTNAFYSEYFISSIVDKTGTESNYSYDAIYWIPKRWRSSAWAGIRQVDRAYPMGRFIILGHLLLWILFYHGTSAVIRDGYLMLFILFHNSTLYFLTTDKFGSSAWNHYIQSPANWMMTRFFIQLRWALPLALSLSVIAIFSSHFSIMSVIFWVIVYFITNLIFSFLFTFLHEYRYQKSYE